MLISTRPLSTTPPALGGKATNLLALQEAGFRVPPFVVSPANLREAVERVGFPIAVRSSATVEDGRVTSFAGQFESFLDLRTLEDVERAVGRVRASVHSHSVGEYCRKNGIDPASVRMNVIVQRMIRPQLAGVVFTVNPRTGAEEVVIEAVEGLADKLLAGVQQPLFPRHPLLKRFAPEIESVARRIQRHFGAPQDVEFAIENETLYVLQARPITRIDFAPEIGEWTNADFRDGGVSSGPCTPLMWSLYDTIWEDALKGFLREIKLLDSDFRAGRMFFGRPYWNLGAVKRCLAKLPGFVEREFDKDLSVRVTYEGDGIRTPFTPWKILRAIPTMRAVERRWREQERFDRDFLAGGFDLLERWYEQLPHDLDAGFRQLIERAYRLTETNYFRTIFCASLAKLDFKDSFPDADYPALVAGLPPMRHLAPARAMQQMAERGETDVTPLLRHFRHHGRRELDIRAPRWDEDRTFVEDLLRQCTGSGGDDPRPAYERALAQALARLPRRKRGRFTRKLQRLRLFIWLREEMRDCSSRMYYLIRRYVLELARRRNLGDDIFFMTLDEILRNERPAVDRRREIYESTRNFKAPNEIGSRFAFSRAAPTGALTGIGASRGMAKGPARIARSVEEAAGVEKGAILVCPFTDPGWTPILDRVAGVVTETGGLLSHAAIICREYGIPAVLGVPGATERILDGTWVTVDGDRECVTIEPSKEAHT
ncbi:MAG: hypothetical protein HYY16_10820 [Planctomycetes bacterium]|nr:hypothetical protein [Planctomycetota bacterium]